MWILGIGLRLSWRQALLEISEEQNCPSVVSFSDYLTWICVHAPIQALSYSGHKDLKKKPALFELKRVFYLHLSAPPLELAWFLLACLALNLFSKTSYPGWLEAWFGKGKEWKLLLLTQLLLRATELRQTSKGSSEHMCKCACMCSCVCRCKL